MFATVLTTHDGLLSSSRLPALARGTARASAGELALLLLAGAGAALATAFMDFDRRVPGHAILRAVFPMALGLALVPRRLGGAVMGTGALVTALGLKAGGWASVGPGAMTSLCLTGPLLDLALWGARGGWRLYLGFVLAGLGSNLAALAVRYAAKVTGLGPGRRRVEEWGAEAVVTYALCGIMAGLLSAFVWFQLGRRSAGGRTP